MNTAQIQYVADQQGKPTAVIVPIEVWQKILAEKETAYLLKSKTMKKRLLAAKGGEAFAKLGI